MRPSHDGSNMLYIKERSACLTAACLLGLPSCSELGDAAWHSAATQQGAVAQRGAAANHDAAAASAPGHAAFITTQLLVPPPAGRRSAVAMITALAQPYTGAVLDHLGDGGRASGYQLPVASGLALPLSASATDTITASDQNFFSGDRTAWTQLRTASSNNYGVLAGHGVVHGRHISWIWNGKAAIRHPLPPGYTISAVVGPADDGSFAADTYNLANFSQEILWWQGNGSRSILYRNVQAKAGMLLFDIASNGIIGAIEREGIALTPKLHDGQWRTLPFDYFSCRCEAKRVNARGQVLMSPLPGRGGDPQGYLVSRAGATLLPRAGQYTSYADLNDLGDVVGNSGGRPIVIFDGVLHDLNTYTNIASTGWQLLTAVAINQRRQILGAGLWQGQSRWYLLSLR